MKQYVIFLDFFVCFLSFKIIVLPYTWFYIHKFYYILKMEPKNYKIFNPHETRVFSGQKQNIIYYLSKLSQHKNSKSC